MKLTSAEIVSAVEAEEALALDNGELSAQREDALQRYRGEPYGNEIDGRSQIVDRGVANAIEWVMPALVRCFMGGDEIGEFEPRGPEDEQAAEIETDVVNFYVQQKNDFFSQISATLRDSLLLKNGYLVAFWTKRYDTMTETYIGQSPEEAAMLMQDAEVEVLEHTERMDPVQGPVHDLKVEKKVCDEYPAIESVPPDEMLVSKRHRWTSLADADFVQWRRRVTIGQLRAEGFDVSDEAPGFQEWAEESVSRDRFGDTLDDDESNDITRRVVLFKDTYVRLDLRGQGTPQLWRVAIIDGMEEPTLLEEADMVPFAAFTPVVYPHSHVGSSLYDQIQDIALVKTTLLRQYLDGVYMANAGRVAVDSARVNLDDLLVTRPGGVVRVDGDPASAMYPIVAPDVTGTVLQGLQYVDGMGEQRTGVRAWTEGLGQASLHPTATGVASVDSQAAQRIELIARTLASGFRDLYCIVHALVCKHGTKPVQMRLNNAWQVIDPRTWVKRTDFTVSVGLGVGSPDMQLAKLQALGPMMQQAMGMGLAGPQEAYEYATEVLKAAGYRLPDRFVKPPQPNPETGQVEMPPPPPSPQEKVKQMDLQAEQLRLQADAQKFQAMQTADQQKFQAQQAAEKEKLAMEDQLQQRRLAAELEVQRQNDERDAAADLLKHQREQETKLAIAQLQSATSIEVAKISRGLDENLTTAQEQMGAVAETAETANAVSEQLAVTLAQGLEQMRGLMEQLAQAVQVNAAVQSAPKRIVRDPMTGKAIGVEPVRTIQ